MFPAFLAQAGAASAPALDPSNPVVFLGLLIGGVITLVTLINQIDQMAQRRKRVPAIESEFVTKQEFSELKKGVDGELKLTRIALEKLTSSINRDFNTLYRALGKVEGITLPERRDDNE